MFEQGTIEIPNAVHSRFRIGLVAASGKLGGLHGRSFTARMLSFSIAARQQKTRELQASGDTSLRAIAAGLDERGIPAAHRGKWAATRNAAA
jgi:hypothetical protein